VVAELEKPARGNWEELERPSDICNERPIGNEGLSMRREKKRIGKEREKKKGKKGSTEKQPAHENAISQLENYIPPRRMYIRIRR
jgi:hypothetical protein